jgi:hypothetical protein
MANIFAGMFGSDQQPSARQNAHYQQQLADYTIARDRAWEAQDLKKGQDFISKWLEEKDLAVPPQMGEGETLPGEAPVTGLNDIIGSSPAYQQMSPYEQALRLSGAPTEALRGVGESTLQTLIGNKQQANLKAGEPIDPSNAMKMAQEAFPNDPEKQRAAVMAYMQKADTISLGGEKAISIPDLENLMLPGGGEVPVGTTYAEAKTMGAILRNTKTDTTAGRLAMMETSKSLFDTIDTLMFQDDGSLNEEVIRDAFAISLDPTPGEGLTKSLIGFFGDEEQASKAGQVYQAFEQGFQALTRTETGAAMPAEEIENTKKRFRPSPFDSSAEVMQKYNAYKLFINSAIKYMRPESGSGPQYKDDVGALTTDINALADKALISAGAPNTSGNTPRDENLYEYVTDDLPPGAIPVQ